MGNQIWNFSPDYSLNCTPISRITITNSTERYFYARENVSSANYFLLRILIQKWKLKAQW